MIILSQAIGQNYRKITLRHAGAFSEPIVPGVCAKVNGRWLAVAGNRQGEFDFILPAKHPLHDEEITEVQFPVGRGFLVDALVSPIAVAIGGGTGIGAIVNLVEQRAAHGLQTHVIIYARNVKKEQILDAFPPLRGATILGCWDTVLNGRPLTPLGMLSIDNKPIVFFAGPKSLHEALIADPRRPRIILNY